MSLKQFQRAFEKKLLFGFGFACEKVTIIRVKANGKQYRFLRLDGNNGDVPQIPPFNLYPYNLPTAQESYLYLITNNRFLRKETEKLNEKTFMARNMKARFGNRKTARYKIDQFATDPSPSTCMSVHIDHTAQLAALNNISVHPFCAVESMDELMRLFDALLARIQWKGKVMLSDSAMKNGVRVAVYYMRSRKDEPDKFSKYQDYGFQVQPNYVAELRKIKKDVLTLTDKAATTKYDDKLHDLLAVMFRPHTK